jgi:hypothetical protein
VPRRRLRRFGVAQTVLFVPLAALDMRMQRAGGPGNIAFELAGTPQRARSIMGRWGEEGRRAARASLLLDYPFLVSYTGFGLAATAIAAEELPAPLAALAPAVAAGQVVAAACDAAENTALLGVLAGREESLAPVARGFARAKFALLGVGWAYSLLGLAARLRR